MAYPPRVCPEDEDGRRYEVKVKDPICGMSVDPEAAAESSIGARRDREPDRSLGALRQERPPR